MQCPYRGRELETFDRAIRWKRYWSSKVAPYLRGRVLEVGAGSGNNTPLLHGLARDARWTCLEPDPALREALGARLRREGLAERVRVVAGTTAALDPAQSFDAILYADVLEHIEDDRSELERAARLLAARGHLIVLAPAHAWLFSRFDREVGHHRRYTLRGLRAIAPEDLAGVEAGYLDSVGILPSLLNRLLLRQDLPSAAQVGLWDRGIVPVSRLVDRLTRGAIGKSLLVVWQKQA